MTELIHIRIGKLHEACCVRDCEFVPQEVSERYRLAQAKK